ncbi:hypothetical protein ACFUMH_04080 [Cellulomonas sp. NPDC057328]|uniref:hypothetical protein n=1 Tax=Cellulomonas sp. NPDC057328 TaxID=3346101 RepID=UPI00363F9A9F
MPSIRDVLDALPRLAPGNERLLDGYRTTHLVAARGVLERVCDEISDELVGGLFRVEPDGRVHRVRGQRLHRTDTAYTRRLWYARLWSQGTTDSGDDIRLDLTSADSWDKVLTEWELDPWAELDRQIAGAIGSSAADRGPAATRPPRPTAAAGAGKPAPTHHLPPQPQPAPQQQPQVGGVGGGSGSAPTPPRAPSPAQAARAAERAAAALALRDLAATDPRTGPMLRPDGTPRSRLSQRTRAALGVGAPRPRRTRRSAPR